MAFFTQLLPCLCILTASLFFSGDHRRATASDHRPKDNYFHAPQFLDMTFYFHDIIGGPNVTSMNITSPRTPSGFGTVNMIDNPLTAGPDLKSKLVGRAQGLYADASLDVQNLALLMVMNLHFNEYNGSTISILGRNAVFDKVREMPVVGGTGIFRFARGYAEAQTVSLTFTVAVVKYNLHLMY